MMKSLALHLVVILTVGSLRRTIDGRRQLMIGLAESSATATSSAIATTSQQPPSLLAPRGYYTTTTTMTPSITTKTKSTAAATAEITTKRSVAHAVTYNDVEPLPKSRRRSDGQNSSMNGRSTPAVINATSLNNDDRNKSINNINRIHRRQVFKPNQISSTASSEEHQSRSASSHKVQQALKLMQQQQPPVKTSRVVHRLVGGHIQNGDNGRAMEMKKNATTTLKPSSSVFFRRKSFAAPLGGKSNIGVMPLVSTTSEPPFKALFENSEYDRDDDAALLDDSSSDLDSWDNGILRLSAGSGSEVTKTKKKSEDSKKTLSDQVREGKYGLIEQELFSRKPKRPGVISYLPNKEIPVDNESNYGGLDEEDIWLAEDHLLVIKGGSLNGGDEFRAIDNYEAPDRQIKIPSNPKVPPPFPVQLEENGPVQLIGNNKFPIIYPLANESLPIYPPSNENYTPSESDGDNEKNLLTRPGSAQEIAHGGKADPNYFYPAPYPPWIYHNQTFVNPFLSNSVERRPIALPGIGPFTFPSNVSLGNETGDYDEDDPSLYYPPPYSFVYKNNHTSRVPPGPLVPGIVVPPPPHLFSRLEKQEKHRKPFRPTTKSKTTEMPLRQILTKITEYTPTTVTVTKPPPVVAINSQSKLSKRPSNTKVQSPTVEPVPVPVAVPVPIYPSEHYSTARPHLISFVPTSPTPPTSNTLSKTNPIYYEYYETNDHHPTEEPFISNYIPTTPYPTVPRKTSKVYPTSKRQFKNYQSQQRNPVLFAAAGDQPSRKFVYEDYVYITPKPDIRPNGIASQSRPLELYERDINVIRSTLHFYHNQQQLRETNTAPRTPKAKPIHDDYSRLAEPTPLPDSNNNFHPPTEFDDEPFKPMVTYSPAVGDVNAFRAIAFDKVDNDLLTPQSQSQPPHSQPRQKFYTTTLLPVQSQQQPVQPRSKKVRLGTKHLQQQQQQQPPAPNERTTDYESSPRTILTTQPPPPWVSVEKQVVSEVSSQQQQQQQQRSSRLQLAPQTRVRGYNGYYYGPPPLPIRQNNRFYDDPFHSPVRQQQVVGGYLPPHLPAYSLQNDTNVNYAPNRPPINPDAEIINPYQTVPSKPYQRYQQQQPQHQHQHQYSRRPPPPHQQQPQQSQFYLHPSEKRVANRFPHLSPPPAPIQLPPNIAGYYQSQPQQQIPLDRDIQVNYQDPRPPINPNSENISHPNVVRIPSYGAIHYRQPDSSGEEQPGDYYIAPKYRRGNGQ